MPPNTPVFYWGAPYLWLLALNHPLSKQWTARRSWRASWRNTLNYLIIRNWMLLRQLKSTLKFLYGKMQTSSQNVGWQWALQRGYNSTCNKSSIRSYFERGFNQEGGFTLSFYGTSDLLASGASRSSFRYSLLSVKFILESFEWSFEYGRESDSTSI